MRRSAVGAVGLAATVAAVMWGGPAQAQDTVYFNYQGLNCAVADGGVLGCDLPSGMVVMQRPGFLPSGSADDLTLPVPGQQIIQDVADGPMRAASLPGTPFTLPGGNPPPVLAPNGCPGQGCTPNPPLLGTQIVCGDGHYMALGCRTPGGHGFRLPRPGQVVVY
ncbi:hypothetical protein [Nocardia sp. NPDC048505]|uniref:hypothetical protein n=1 Tax=unclassified Nocardia TaxID=2637762 RepID=UPI0033F93844